MGWGGWVPTAQERAEDKLREELKTLRAVINAPTPREQELEAQNKALWELVDNCLPYVQSFTSKKFENHAEAELILEAIQKAKVLAITPQQNESEEDGR